MEEDGDFGWFDVDGGDDSMQPPDQGYAAYSSTHNAGSAANRNHAAVEVTAAAASAEAAAPCADRERLSPVSDCPHLMSKSFAASTFAWGVGGLRIVRTTTGVAHAEFQIVASVGGSSWIVWKRIGSIAKLAENVHGCRVRDSATQRAWEDVLCAVSARGDWRDPHYLRGVCVLVREFMRHYLFACNDVEALLAFVAHSSSYRCLPQAAASSSRHVTAVS